MIRGIFIVTGLLLALGLSACGAPAGNIGGGAAPSPAAEPSGGRRGSH